MNTAAAIVLERSSAEISVSESILLSLLGFAIVFVVLIVLIAVIKLITGATEKIESIAQKATETELAAAIAATAAASKLSESIQEEELAEVISAPIQGTVFEINVTTGQAIKKGMLLVVIEAMYMENEVLAQRDGTVSQVICKVGENVNVAAPLIVLEQGGKLHEH